jgi:hypothetical protein
MNRKCRGGQFDYLGVFFRLHFKNFQEEKELVCIFFKMPTAPQRRSRHQLPARQGRPYILKGLLRRIFCTAP